MQIRSAGPHAFRGAESQPTDGAVILHYACATYEIWWRKYARLGAFSDNWLENPDTPIKLSTHLKSRDVVTEALRTGDAAPAEAYFRELMLPEDTPGLLRTLRSPTGEVKLAATDSARGH